MLQFCLLMLILLCFGEESNYRVQIGKSMIPSRMAISPLGSLNKKSMSQACSNTTGFCSPWVYRGDNGECKCGATPRSQNLKCDNLSIVSSNCLTYNDKENLFEAGKCLYTGVKEWQHILTHPKSITELNELMCGKPYNRRGIVILVVLPLCWSGVVQGAGLR